ncbi:unnamed protein product [Brassica rapa]|uniref:DUF4005 domain-containing protein n=2 Tax=Brassica TaxID=3705 RepID=A0A8D9G4A2_BRACM|nr:unnamed protein product [Brassica napus]CAG7866762.1 unnamed protein product [Brassica rapa]
MVRRQAVATCVMGNVKLQALARGREIRRSDIGVEVHSKCRLNQETKLPEDSVVDTHTYLGIKKLTSNVFARKENKKSVGKKDFTVTATQTTECEESNNGNENSSQGLPSYMQATKSEKAKLSLQGSSTPRQQGDEKATRRYSLPSSGNNARVTSDSPKQQE